VVRLRHATQLDPRNVNIASQLADLETMLHHYAAADSAADRGVSLAPTNPRTPWQKVLVELARGDLDSARAVIRAAVRQVDPTMFYCYVATYQDLYWVLEDAAQQQVLQAAPSAFDDDRGNWGIVRAQLYHLRGDRARTVIYADSARLAFGEQSRAAPQDPGRHAALGLALAYLGRKADAVREGQRAMELLPVSQDHYTGPYYVVQLARIYLLIGEPDKALDQLEAVLRQPYYLSPSWLRIDPTFDPVRNNPRFQKLVAGVS
jgi:tetratricopeptide (TPR) repeat protein